MRVVAATHGHCFDGMASAVLFTKLVRHVVSPRAEVKVRACGYGVNQPKPDAAMLNGAENAILDYRFSPVESLTWYFDHHRTAFASDSDRALFDARVPTGRFHFDAECSSCTKLIADVAKGRFGLELPELSELMSWADLLDSARFESAAHAIDRTEPIMQLATVVEHHGTDAFLDHIVRELLEKPLTDVARSSAIAKKFVPLGLGHAKLVERTRAQGEVMGRVVFVDLTNQTLEAVGKFVTYALYPACAYSVVVGKLKTGIKISVGYNPWCGAPLDADISTLCARHGGGGHRAVGGIAFPLVELPRALDIARGIARELDGG